MDQILIENSIKVLLAVVVGGLIGAEREFQDKAAGFRTIILITIGSALFTIFSISMDPANSRTRIAANIVTGIGFLGAGAIVREGGRIGGLTTAATIWLSAALGMGIGAGELWLVLAATGITLVILLIFPRVEERIDRIREVRTYRIITRVEDHTKIEKLAKIFEDLSLRVCERHQTKSEKTIISTWKTVGSLRNQDKFVQLMLKDKEIRDLDY
jgi:putative Mg2+ transporter-C (MgtC) family protein